jgi:hypothetical protein
MGLPWGVGDGDGDADELQVNINAAGTIMSWARDGGGGRHEDASNPLRPCSLLGMKCTFVHISDGSKTSTKQESA